MSWGEIEEGEKSIVTGNWTCSNPFHLTPNWVLMVLSGHLVPNRTRILMATWWLLSGHIRTLGTQARGPGSHLGIIVKHTYCSQSNWSWQWQSWKCCLQHRYILLHHLLPHYWSPRWTGQKSPHLKLPALHRWWTVNHCVVRLHLCSKRGMVKGSQMQYT